MSVFRRRRRPLPGEDAGAAAVEFTGLTVLAAIVLSALLTVPIAPQVAEGIRAVICRISGTSCGDQRPAPRCVVATRDRTMGLSATAFSVTVGHDDAVRLVEYGDGRARVVTADTYEAGGRLLAGGRLSISDLSRELAAKGYADISLTGSAGLQLAFDFDTTAEARQWIREHRGVLNQTVNMVGGPAADGIEQGMNWLARRLGAGGDGVRGPTAVIAEVGAQLKGGGGYGLGTLVGTSARGNAGATGAIELDLRDGTTRFTGALEAGVVGEADLAFLVGQVGIAGKASYTVRFDADGSPVELTLSGAASPTWQAGTLKEKLPVARSGTLTYGGSGGTGSTSTRRYVMNLLTPANRAAFDRAFVTAGPVVLPRIDLGPTPSGAPVDPGGTAPAFAPLVQRLRADAVYVQARYDTTKAGGKLEAAFGEAMAFGAGGRYENASTSLVEAMSQDFGVASSTLSPLSSCAP